MLGFWAVVALNANRNSNPLNSPLCWTFTKRHAVLRNLITYLNHGCNGMPITTSECILGEYELHFLSDNQATGVAPPPDGNAAYPAQSGGYYAQPYPQTQPYYPPQQQPGMQYPQAQPGGYYAQPPPAGYYGQPGPPGTYYPPQSFPVMSQPMPQSRPAFQSNFR